MVYNVVFKYRREGSIKAGYDIFFTESSNVKKDELDRIMKEGLEAGCLEADSGCTIDNLVGVQVNRSAVFGNVVGLNDLFCGKTKD